MVGAVNYPWDNDAWMIQSYRNYSNNPTGRGF
jgi:hypothetical protein